MLLAQLLVEDELFFFFFGGESAGNRFDGSSGRGVHSAVNLRLQGLFVIPK